MEPEQRARQLIDDLLHTAGWVVQGRADLNLGAGRGIAVREFAVRPGDAADLRFVDRQAVGVIEATTFGFTWTGVEEQSATYRMGLPAGIVAAREPLPFASESTGSETRFTNDLEPAAARSSPATVRKPWPRGSIRPRSGYRPSRTTPCERVCVGCRPDREPASATARSRPSPTGSAPSRRTIPAS